MNTLARLEPRLHSTTQRIILAGLALAFACVVTSASAQQTHAPLTVPDTLQQRIAACTSCHGVHGEGSPGSGYFPRLAGKPAAYLARQIHDFQKGLRKYAPMQYTVLQLPPSYINEIAEYFSAQQVPYRRSPVPALSPTAVQRGHELIEKGDPSRKIPPCSSCHGRELTGVEPSTPGLVGLPYDYISSQLGSWRTHTRSTVAPDCMATIANRLNAADITTVAAALASRDLPADTRPQPAGSVKPPLRCGVLETSGGKS